MIDHGSEASVMRLALGPILYFWEAARVYDFYRQVERWPVDIVYLGETVCAKRRALALRDWLEIAERLQVSGKQVVLSTLTLIEAASELSQCRQVCHNGHYQVEANDMSVVALLAQHKDFVGGSTLNIYNPHTLRWLSHLGMRRWVMPLEMGAGDANVILAQRPPGLEIEVFAFGRLPLAHSARCFTARAHGLSKDACGFKCSEYPDGLPLQTQEGAEFLQLNGIQTQSARVYNLLTQVSALRDMGVDILRLSPQTRGMANVVEAFHSVLAHGADPMHHSAVLAAQLQQVFCNGYWFEQPGMNWHAQGG